MPPIPRIPEEFRHRPFSTHEATRAGLTRKQLCGRSFRRVFPRVWVHVAYEMTHADWIEAARIALTDRAELTGITRIQALGLRFGPLRPLRFVVVGDLHIDIDGVFLHRTRRLPPTDDVGVTPAGAFIAYCATARVIDAIQVGDWLAYHGHMSVLELCEVASGDRWRAGASEALWVARHLHPESRSLPESQVRALTGFAGLPAPEVNAQLDVDGRVVIIDLLWRRWRLALEYEGSQHQTDRTQYLADIDRYGILREIGLRYVQVTKEHLARPRSLVLRLDEFLRRGGYDGPPPVFAGQWTSLFGPISACVPPRRGGPVPFRRQGR